MPIWFAEKPHFDLQKSQFLVPSVQLFGQLASVLLQTSHQIITNRDKHTLLNKDAKTSDKCLRNQMAKGIKCNALLQMRTLREFSKKKLIPYSIQSLKKVTPKSYIKCAYSSFFWFDKRPVLSIHLVVEATGVAQVMSSSVPPPQRSTGSPTIDTLTAF